MKIRTKLLLAFGFLFVLVIILGAVGSYYLQELSEDSGEIIQDNYHTLQYVHRMDDAVDVLQHIYSGNITAENQSDIETAWAVLDSNFKKQASNITETGERQLVTELAAQLEQLQPKLTEPKASPQAVLGNLHLINEVLSRIYDINQDAVLMKNNIARETARQATLYVWVFSLSVALLSFFTLIGIPPLVSRPIRELNRAIRQISSGNYRVSLPDGRTDEFGEMAGYFNKMTLKLQEYEESNYATIISERNRLDAVINQMSEAIIGLDQAKHIVFVNKRARQLLNISETELLGKYAPDIAVANSLMNTLMQGLMIPIEDDKYPPLKIAEDRTEKLFAKEVVEVTHRPTGENRDVHIGHVIILTDITEFSEKDQAKTYFMATLSHELKTPVAAIEMGAELLRNEKLGPLSEEQMNWLKTIEENNHRIKRAVNEVLEMSRIESGMIEVENTTVNLEQSIESAVLGVAPFANEKNISIEKTYHTSTLEALADPHKLIWVMNNLLMNAIRHTPKEGHIRFHLTEYNERFVKMSVIDEGEGISRQDQKLIFQRFQRGAGEKSDGMGLGLAISKEFVEAMGGSMGVNSEPGKGSEFWIKLEKA